MKQMHKSLFFVAILYVCMVMMSIRRVPEKPAVERKHLGRLPLQRERSISLESKAPAEAISEENRPECNFEFDKKIDRIFMIANNPNPSQKVLDFVKDTVLTDKDIVVRFNHGLHMDWWGGRTDLNFFRMWRKGYHGLPEGFKRNGLHCVINKNKEIQYESIDGIISMPNSREYISKGSLSSGLAAVLTAHNKLPPSTIYLVGFDFHKRKNSKWHTFSEEAEFVKTLRNVVNLDEPLSEPETLPESETAIKNMNVVIFVLSRRNSFDTRQTIRRTWANKHNNVYFAVGSCCPIPPKDRVKWTCKRARASSDRKQSVWTSECNEEDEKLANEQLKYNDIIRMPETDVYRHLPQKVKYCYKWGIMNTNAKWFVKTDDDSVVRISTLEHYLDETYDANDYTVIGRIASGWSVPRGGKWAEPNYKPRKYPNFPLGSVGHIVSRKVTEYIVEHSDSLFNYQGEDVSIGIWLNESPLKSKIKWKTSKHMTNSGKCKDTSKWVIGHNIKPAAMQACFSHKDEVIDENKKVDKSDKKEEIKVKVGTTNKYKTVQSRPECNFKFDREIERIFMIANNPNPSQKVFDFVKQTTLSDKDIVVRFNNGMHIDWWKGRTDLNFFRMASANPSGFHGLPNGFSRSGLHCVINVHPTKKYDKIDGILDSNRNPKVFENQRHPSSGFSAIVVARKNLPNSIIYLLGFDFHRQARHNWHDFKSEADHASSMSNVINVDTIIRSEDPKPTCAIVLNAGVLLKHEDGPVIDSYDWQIRFNMLSTKGFENHVGSKTTHEVVHFWSPKGKTPGELFSDLDSDKITGITFPIEQKEINGYNRWKTKTKSNWIMPSQDYLSRCKRKVGMKSGWCSSGMLATLWAVEQCSSVTVFGANHDPCYPYHYTDQMPAKCKAQTVNGYFKSKHNFDDEHKLLQKMHRDGKLNLFRFEETSKTNRKPRHIYIDLGANWCNTLDMYKEINLNMDDEIWEIYAFEASPFLQRYVNDYVDYKNGIREEPIVNVPRSGSSYDLASYGPKYGCRGSINAIKSCIYSKIGPELKKLKPDPYFVNNANLIHSRKSLAAETPIKTRYVHIPAAAGNRDGSFQVWGDEKSQLIGGVTSVNIGKWQAYTVPVVDIVTWMRKYFSKDDFIVLKMDIEGAEFPILNEMLDNNDIQNINYLLMECHSKGGNCNTLRQRLRRVQSLVVMEEEKDYKLHSYNNFDKK